MNDWYNTNEFNPGFGHFWRHWGSQRMGRGDISPIVLHVLQEKPMHGYEIIRKLEEKSHGFWRPSAGSIYPTLQMLEEQDLVKSREENGKKVYELTDAGREEEQKAPFHRMPPHWKEHMHRGKRFAILKETMIRFVTQMREIGSSGSDEHVQEAKQIIDKAVGELEKLADKVREEAQNK